MNKGIVSENQQKGYMPFKETGTKKGKSFGTRLSRGVIMRQARRYMYEKSGAVKLILV